MALWDHRTFEADGEWWAAQVHGGVGVGTGRIPQTTQETVYFTCLPDKDQNSLTNTIPAGWLNRLSHRSILRLLERARPFGTRFNMAPYNAPDPDELKGLQLTDDEGLAWVIVERTASAVFSSVEPQAVPSLEVICLDDSALRGTVPFQDRETLRAFEETHGQEGMQELVRLIKGDLRDYDPDRGVR